MNRRQLGAMAIAGAFCTVLSCSDRSASDISGIALDDSTADESLVASVAVTLNPSSIEVGKTSQAAAQLYNRKQWPLYQTVSWSSTDTAIATVSTSGVVTGRAPGSVDIVASRGTKSGRASLGVTPASGSTTSSAPVATVAVSPATSSPAVGTTVQLTATTRDAGGNVLSGRAVVWSSANPGIVSVNSASGLVTAVAAGSVQVTATSEGKSGAATFSVQAIPPPPPPGSSNEPTGMALIDERTFLSLNEHASPFVPAWDTDNTLSIVQDPTAPKSPSSVIRVTFPGGFSGGSSNGHSGVQFSGRRVLYISYYMKYSSNWWGHNTGINKHGYAWVSAGYTPFVMEAEGSGSGPLKPRPILQRMIKGDGNYEPNLVPSATIPRGKWFRIEIVLTGNSSGTANGSMDVYLDGVHVTSAGGLQWTTGTTSWNIFELYPVWGGIGDTVPATMSVDWDDVYLSGKN